MTTDLDRVERSVPTWWREVLDEASVDDLSRYRRPRSTFLPLDRSALVVVDVVDSFVGPDEPVQVAQQYARTACGEKAWAALPAIAALREGFREAGRPVIYTVVDSLQTHVGAATVGELDVSGPRGDLVHEAVAPATSDVVLPKTRSSAFFATPLAALLVRQEIRTVVLCGCTTSGCILASAIDASSFGFDVIVVRDACFDRVDALAQAALVTLDAKWARVRSLEGVLTDLSSSLA